MTEQVEQDTSLCSKMVFCVSELRGGPKEDKTCLRTEFNIQEILWEKFGYLDYGKAVPF